MQMESPAASAARRRRMIGRLAVAALALLAVVGCTSESGSGGEATASTSGPDSTELSTTVVTDAGQVDESVVATTDAPGVRPEGFTTTTVRITTPDGEVCEVCMWLADDAAERGRGLMGVTDLGDAAGMAFVFDRPTTGSFYMFQTVTPLSIAWFAPDGGIVSTTDMEPCAFTDSAACERFAAGGQFDLAIEVFQGDLASVGIVAGSTADIVAGTEAETCPATL